MERRGHLKTVEEVERRGSVITLLHFIRLSMSYDSIYGVQLAAPVNELRAREGIWTRWLLE